MSSAQVLESEWPEVRAAGGWARQIGLSSPGEALGLGFILLSWLWALPARAFWPSGQDRPQQVDLVGGCAGAAWRMGGAPPEGKHWLEESLGHVD